MFWANYLMYGEKRDYFENKWNFKYNLWINESFIKITIHYFLTLIADI